MKKIIFLIFSSILLSQNVILSQESILHTQIKKIMAKELFLVDEFFGGGIVINAFNFDIADTNFVQINHITKLWGKYSADVYHYDILKVNVSFVNLTAPNKGIDYLDTISFDYIIVAYSPYQLYKLLGFTTTDINKTQHTFYPYKNNKYFLKWVVQTLVENQYLSNKEGRYMLKSLINEKYAYDRRINQPINLINAVYPEYLCQSLILPYRFFAYTFRYGTK